MPNILYRTFNFASGASVSDEFTVELGSLLGIYMPDAWTPAALTLQASRARLGWLDIYDRSGAEMSISAGAGRFIALDGSLGLGFGPWLRLRSGTAAAPVVQSAARQVTVAYRQFG